MDVEKNIEYDDEVDLSKVIARLGRFIRKWRIRIILSFLVGSGVGLVWSLAEGFVYKDFLLIELVNLSEPHFRATVDRFNRLLGGDISPTSRLGMSEEEVRKILGVKILDDLSDNRFFLLELEVFDPTVWPILQARFIYYIEKNSYLQDEISRKKELYEAELRRIDRRIAALYKANDALLTITDKNRRDFDVDLLPIRIEINELERKRQSLLIQLSSLQSVKLVEGFTMQKRPEVTKIIRDALVLGGISLLLSIVIFAFVDTARSSTSQTR